MSPPNAADINADERTVAQRIRAVRSSLAPAELSVVNVLVGNYPMAGLVPIAELATEAKVSAPTVLRLVGKLGFTGYGPFRAALREEVQTRLFSPVDVYPEHHDGASAESPLATAQSIYFEGMRSTFGGLQDGDIDAVVAALCDPERTVKVIGGRFSTVLAEQLAAYLTMLRPGVAHVRPDSGAMIAASVDIDAATLVVVFDYRRYQQTTIEWARAAADAGATLVLLTDPYLSPLASEATHLLTSSSTGLGPFDSMTHGFMLTELLISLVASELGETARHRLSEFENRQMAEERPRRPSD